MFFVLAEKPFFSKNYFLFAGNNFSIRWKKSALQTQEKHLCQAEFFCIFMHYFLLKFYLDFGPKNTL